MKTFTRTFAPTRGLGFSLIEVLIAVVVLATGLLALAALQSALSRNAADARARSQVAAFVDLAVERVRTNAAGANFIRVPPATTWVQPWTTAEEDAIEARAGASNLNVSVTGTHYDGRTGSFVVYNASGTAGPLKLSDPQYKELRVVATWTDATGTARRYDLTTIISPRTTSDSGTPFDAPTGQSNESKVPIVRTTSPVEPGVIPIAIGDDSDTAATNPKPTIASGNVIRTSYEVLTYRNESDGSAKQQRRVETAIIGCNCSAGAAPTGVFAGTAQWPAYWNGERYTLYTPTPTRAAPGTVAATGPTSGVSQDVLCTQCCRDHHDTASVTDIRFDPFRTDVHQHYKLASGTLTPPNSGEPYLEACRMIRTDGFWRTAQDLNSKHFGLLKTENSGGTPIPENNPDTPLNSAVEFYERFVIDFLKFNYVPGQSPQTADALYQSKGLNDPEDIRINRPTPADERYLHARGLYVDSIEIETRDKITGAAANCTRTNIEECILPLLPFTTINLTEPAFWSAADITALTVDSDGFVVFNSQFPNRGRVNAIATAPPNAVTNVIPRIQGSNSGIAVRDRGIDPQDDVDQTDTQQFTVVGGVGSGSSGRFMVDLSGLPVVQRSPAVSWTIATNSGNCQGPDPYNCITTQAAGTVNATITVAAYNVQEQVSFAVTVTCPNSPSSPTTPSIHTYSPTGQDKATICRNYRLSSAAIGLVPGSIGVPTRDGLVGNQSSGAGSEQTSVGFTNLTLVESPNTPVTVSLGFTLEGTYTVAPVTSCTFKRNGTLNTVLFAPCP